MAKYRVIVYESTALTHEVEADSPEAAEKVWENIPHEELNCVDAKYLGADDVRVELIEEED